MKPYTKISETSPTPKTSSAPEIVDDLLTQIFLLLPIKSLIRFQSVSQHWRSLITNPQSHNPNPPSVGLIFPFPNMVRGIARSYAYVVPLDKSSSTSPTFRKLRFTKGSASPWDIKILDSCNGLLVCGVKEFYYSLWNYYIHNPTTNKYSKLPKLDEGSNWMPKKIDRMCLAFDPSKSPHYKVVCVRELRDQYYKFEVYSSQTGSWDKRGEPFTAKVNFENGVYCKGAIHWIGFTETKKSIYFNPDNDRMPRVMPTPPIYWTHDNYRARNHFGGSCDHLHFVDTRNVYEMRRHYSEWFVKYKVCLPIDVSGLVSICSLVRGNNDEDSFLFFNIRGRIVRFNLVDRTFEIVRAFKESDMGGYNLVHACSRTYYETSRRGFEPPDAIFPL